MVGRKIVASRGVKLPTPAPCAACLRAIFLSQPFFAAEEFTGDPGKFIPLEETLRGFKEILDGRHDSIPEQAFYMVGTIDDAMEKARDINQEASE